MRPDRARVLCLVLAGGEGSRMGPLTAGRSKPTLPIGGHHRLIDVALSNAAHSQLTNVWVVQQYEPHLLDEHIAGGRPWDLDRTRGGLRMLPPYEGESDDGFAEGNADALLRNWPVIEQAEPDVLLVVSADHLFTIDHRTVIERHLEQNADATVVTTELPQGTDVSRYLVVEERAGTVKGLQYKPDDPHLGTVVGVEVFAYRPSTLREHLRGIQERGEGLGDYGEQLLPSMLEGGTVTALRHEGYWRDLGTKDSYLDGNLDLLADAPGIRLDDPAWPVLTSMPVLSPARVEKTAELDRAWLSPGAEIHGRVVNSIVGPGAVVEAGAEVRHSVLMSGSVVRRGAQVARTIAADGATIGRNARVGAPNAQRPVVIGAGGRVADGGDCPAGTDVDATRGMRAGRNRS